MAVVFRYLLTMAIRLELQKRHYECLMKEPTVSMKVLVINEFGNAKGGDVGKQPAAQL